MYCGFAYPELFCSAAHGGFVLDYVFAEFHGALLNNTFHSSTLQTNPIANNYAWEEGNSTEA